MMPWGSFFHPRDSQGRESRTLWFVAITWLFMSIRFFIGGIDIKFAWLAWTIQPSSMLEYGAAVAAILAVWVGRTWMENTSGSPPTN